MFGKSLFYISKPLLENPNTITNDRVIVDGLGDDLNNIRPIYLDLFTRAGVFPRDPTDLVEQMGTDLARVCSNKYLNLCRSTVAVNSNRRMTRPRLVLDGSSTALRLIPGQVNILYALWTSNICHYLARC